MKKMSELQLLAGQHERITIVEFRLAPGEVLGQVMQGKRFTITKYGRVVADLTPVGTSEPEAAGESKRVGVAL
jgi:antitoxin (DNA-binding transcriptional repressor) of toxin-antitoxin stability system